MAKVIRIFPGRKPITELANAERLVRLHGKDIHYVYLWKRWLVWDGRRWALDPGEGQMHHLAKETVKEIYQEAGETDDDEMRPQLAKWAVKSEGRTIQNNMIALAESEPGVAVPPEAFNAHPWLFNVANGTIDLRTGELHAHKRSDLLTKLSDVRFDPRATCPTWDAFLERILPSVQLRTYFQRAIGYSLTGLTKEQVLFLCHGLGANGKSTAIDTVMHLLSEYGKETDFTTFLKRDHDGVRNDLAMLLSARLVSAAEVESGRALAEVLVKQLTGGDRISVRFLYSEFFEYKPEFKLWLIANHKPVIKGTDYAIWRRVRLLPFDVTIPKQEQDPTLPARLLEELPGILAWAVRGCLDWQQNGLGEPDEVRLATEAYREEMDVLGGFLAERCEIDRVAMATSKDLYQAYLEWAEASGERPISQTAFGTRLTERGFQQIKSTGGTRRRLGLRVVAGVAGSGAISQELSLTTPHEADLPENPPLPATGATNYCFKHLCNLEPDGSCKKCQW